MAMFKATNLSVRLIAISTMGVLAVTVLLLFSVFASWSAPRTRDASVVGGVRQQTEQTPGEQTKSIGGTEQGWRKDFGAWSYYIADREDGWLRAMVTFDHNSVKGIRDFADANRVLANQLADSTDQVEVEVTFRELMTPEEHRAWATAAGITYFDNVHMMADDPLSGSAEMVVRVGSPQPPPQTRYDEEKAAHNLNDRIQGIDSFRGKVDASRLPAIAADPKVFVADVTMNVVRNDLRAAGITDRADIHNSVVVFYFMKQLGLENFK
jgi:hypothetical protein